MKWVGILRKTHQCERYFNMTDLCFGYWRDTFLFQPKTIHDRTQVFLGNVDEIEELKK